MPRNKQCRPFELCTRLPDRPHKGTTPRLMIEAASSLPLDVTVILDVTYCRGHVAVINSDLTLDRVHKVRGTVFELDLTELDALVGQGQVPTLDSILQTFPDQKFVLDLRHPVSPRRLAESGICVNEIEEDLAEGTLRALSKVLTVPRQSQIAFAYSDFGLGSRLAQAFPEYELQLVLDGTLAPFYLHHSTNLRMDEFPSKVIRILQSRIKEIDVASVIRYDAMYFAPRLSQGLMALGFDLFHDTSSATPADTQIDLARWGYARGAQGHVLSEITPQFAAAWRDFTTDPGSARYPMPNLGLIATRPTMPSFAA